MDDAPRSEATPVTHDRTVKHHDLGRDVNRTSDIAASKDGLRSNETLVADSDRVSRAVRATGGSHNGAREDHDVITEHDRRTRSDDQRAVIDDTALPNSHFADDNGARSYEVILDH